MASAHLPVDKSFFSLAVWSLESAFLKWAGHAWLEGCFAVNGLLFYFIFHVYSGIAAFTLHFMAYDPFIQRKQHQPLPQVTQVVTWLAMEGPGANWEKDDQRSEWGLVFSAICP